MRRDINIVAEAETVAPPGVTSQKLCRPALRSEREAIYGVLAQRLVGQRQHPVLLVDGSDLDAWRRNQVLLVSLAVEGRALTV